MDGDWQEDRIPVQTMSMASANGSVPGPLDDFWYTDIGTPNSSGVSVTPESAMRVATVMACVRVLSETIASLPLVVTRDRGEMGKERLKTHQIARLLHTKRGKPNSWQTAVEFREQLMSHLCLRGNAYAEIRSGIDGFATELLPIHPDRVTVERIEDGSLRYEIRRAGKPPRVLSQGDVFHVRGLSSDSVVGMNPIQYAAESVGLSIATERHGASLFRNGARPGGVLQHPGKLEQAAATRLRTDWENMHRGSGNAHRTAVLEDGMTYNAIGMTSEDAQFLETRGFQVVEICRIFRVPPHMVYDLSRATFSNIEHQFTEFVQMGLLPWLTRWEAAIHRDLIPEQDITAEHIVEGLLRGDTKSRTEFYNSALDRGWLSPNEVREKENLNPIEGGDVYLRPMNMQEAGANPDANTDPQPQPEPPQQDSSNARAIFARDIAQRIATRELNAINRKYHLPEDDFRQWSSTYWNSQAAFVRENVLPVVSVFGGDIDGIVSSIASAPTEISGDDFLETRSEAIYTMICERLGNE